MKKKYFTALAIVAIMCSFSCEKNYKGPESVSRGQQSKNAPATVSHVDRYVDL